MKNRLLNYISRRCYHFSLRWRSSLFKNEKVNFINSDRIGPVQFIMGKHSYANGIRVYG